MFSRGILRVLQQRCQLLGITAAAFQFFQCRIDFAGKAGVSSAASIEGEALAQLSNHVRKNDAPSNRRYFLGRSAAGACKKLVGKILKADDANMKVATALTHAGQIALRLERRLFRDDPNNWRRLQSAARGFFDPLETPKGLSTPGSADDEANAH